MSPAQTRRPRWWLAAGLAATGLVLLAGCGNAASASSTGSTSTSANGGTVASSDTQMDAFASCLAENGVTLPERAGGAQGGQPPAGGTDGGTPPQGAAPEGGAAPQGAAPGDGGTPPAPEGVDVDTWAAALKACGDTMPTPPEGGAPPSARPAQS